MRTLCLLAASLGAAHGWATKSQTTFGAQLSEIKDVMNGIASTRHVQAQLGYLWHMPTDIHDERGLGGGITWAWHPDLCSELDGSFEENIFGSSWFVACDDYKAAVARAFDKWSANNRYIKFLDVSEECYLAGEMENPKPGQPHGGCSLAEIWVVSLESQRRRLAELENDPVFQERRRRLSDDDLSEVPAAEQSTGGTAVATATSHIVWSNDFRYTNGLLSNFPVVETVAGTFTFNTQTVCWYMDSGFCSGIHELKYNLGGASNARMFVDGLTYGLMVIGLLFYVCFFATIFFRAASLTTEAEDDEDGDGELSCKERSTAAIRAISHWNPMVLTGFLVLFIVPPLINTQIFLPCFNCYDFEAAALHETGHFMGLGHLDNIPLNWVAPEAVGGYGTVDFAGPTPGANVYHANISSAMENYHIPNFSCTNPWQHVYEGVPPGASGVEHGGSYPYRNAQMEARTQHNPLPCLMNDDLEALAVLYPDCGNYPMTAPVCHRTERNIGLVRCGIYILFPTIFCLVFVIMVTSIVHNFERREKKRMQEMYDSKMKEAEAGKKAMKFQLALVKAQREAAAKKTGVSLKKAVAAVPANAPPSAV